MTETQHIEFKATWRDEYLKWVCGFANAEGGVLCIGRDDTGNVVGLADAERLLEEIPNKVRDILGIIVDVNLHSEPQGDFLEIVVGAHSYPVNYKGQYHYRSGTTKQELKGVALDNFLLRKRGLRWDGVPVPKVSVSDLKADTFGHFRKRALKSQRIEVEGLEDSDQQLLEKLRLVENGMLKRSALLMFHPDPERFVTGAYIKIGHFASDDDLRYQDEIHGNLFEQIEQTMDLLFTKYLKAEISYDGIIREERFDYPKEVVREALLNAIAHKDYSGGIPIQIKVYPDRLILWNIGQLPENWTVERLLSEHPSLPHNPDIANVFFRSGHIESWGRGVSKMMKGCSLAGLPRPEFQYDQTGFRVELKKAESLRKGLNERQLDALVFFKEKGEILTSEYVKKYGVTDRTALRDLSELIERGLIRKEGANRNARYVFSENVG